MKKEKDAPKRVKIKSKKILIAAAIVLVVLALLFFVFKSLNYKKLGDANTNKFTITDVYKDINKDFPNKEAPAYNEVYCMNKYLQNNGEEASYCYITNVKTLTRLNPLVTEVTCACN